MTICPACYSKKLEEIWRGFARKGAIGDYASSNTLAFSCKKCASIISKQTNMYSEESFKTGEYRKSVDGSKFSNPQYFFYKHFEDTIRYLSLIPKKNLINKKVLDFGSGAGSLLNIMSPFIKLGVGIELDKNFHYKKNNISNVSDLLESDKICKKFDLITSYSTFGQLFNTEQTLNNLVKRLKKNGILIIGDVNAQDYLLTNGIKKYKDEVFFRQNYQNYFSEKGLKNIAKRNNLTFLSSKFIQRYEYENISSYLSKKKLNQIFNKSLKKIEIKNYIKSNFENNKISDYMVITFQKKDA